MNQFYPMRMNVTYLEYILDGSVVELTINNDQVGPLVRDYTRSSDAVLAEESHFAKRGARNYRRRQYFTRGTLIGLFRIKCNALVCSYRGLAVDGIEFPCHVVAAMFSVVIVS